MAYQGGEVKKLLYSPLSFWSGFSGEEVVQDLPVIVAGLLKVLTLTIYCFFTLIISMYNVYILNFYRAGKSAIFQEKIHIFLKFCRALSHNLPPKIYENEGS